MVMDCSYSHPPFLFLAKYMGLNSEIKKFFENNLPHGKLLLALSGGPDSLALYHLMLHSGVDFAVAHVDHGWRRESAAQAQELQKKVQVPFHLLTLDPAHIKGNLEDKCRELRLAYFQSLVSEHGYHAVVMGHHADDQGETVLKRFFEASSLTQLAGMEMMTEIHGMSIWRPLLYTPKKALLAYCQENQLDPFLDETNENPRFLRARMRQQIIPELSQLFGKEVVKPLQRMSDEARQLRCYLDEKIAILLDKRIFGPFGWMLDLKNAHPFEIKHLLRGFLNAADEIETAVHLLQTNAANKKVGAFYIDRGYLFQFQPFTLPSEALPIRIGSHFWGACSVKITDVNASVAPLDWKAAWKGEMTACIPLNNCELTSLNRLNAEQKAKMDKRWEKSKVPAFFRLQIPLVQRDGVIVHEFLSGMAKDIQNTHEIRLNFEFTRV